MLLMKVLQLPTAKLDNSYSNENNISLKRADNSSYNDNSIQTEWNYESLHCDV